MRRLTMSSIVPDEISCVTLVEALAYREVWQASGDCDGSQNETQVTLAGPLLPLDFLEARFRWSVFLAQ